MTTSESPRRSRLTEEILKDIRIRPPTSYDLSLILDSWLKGQRCSPVHNYMSNEDYWTQYKQVVHAILQRSFVSILVQREDPSHIIGFLVCEYPTFPDFTIHYIYIKPTYRNLGLSTHLIRTVHPPFGTQPTYVSHLPPETLKVAKDNQIKHHSFFILNRKRLSLTYNPYLQAPQSKETSHG